MKAETIHIVFNLMMPMVTHWQSTTTSMIQKKGSARASDFLRKTADSLTVVFARFSDEEMAEQARPANRWPFQLSMNTNLTFHRSGTGPARSRAGRVPSLQTCPIHPPRQPAIPDEGR
jgi:hypothetical protein